MAFILFVPAFAPAVEIVLQHADRQSLSSFF